VAFAATAAAVAVSVGFTTPTISGVNALDVVPVSTNVASTSSTGARSGTSSANLTSTPTTGSSQGATAAAATPTPEPTATQPTATIASAANAVDRPDERSPRVFLTGDSLAAAFSPTFRALAATWDYTAGVHAIPSCPFTANPPESGGKLSDDAQREECVAMVPGWPNNIERFQPDLVLLMFGAVWAEWMVDGELLKPCDARYGEVMATEVRNGIASLSSGGARVALVLPPFHRVYGLDREDRQYRCGHDVYRSVAAEFDNVVIVPLDEWTCPSGTCRDKVNGEPLRDDGQHFTGRGAEIALQWLFEQTLAPPPSGYPLPE
jgi:hypothetical protein